MFNRRFKMGGVWRLPAGFVEEYLEFLVLHQESHFSNDKYYWMKDEYPERTFHCALLRRKVSAFNDLGR